MAQNSLFAAPGKFFPANLNLTVMPAVTGHDTEEA